MEDGPLLQSVSMIRSSSLLSFGEGIAALTLLHDAVVCKKAGIGEECAGREGSPFSTVTSLPQIQSVSVSHLCHEGKASFRRCDGRSSAIDEGVEHSNTAVTCFQNIRTGIAEGLTGKSASPTTHPHIVHRLDLA